jgi:hypothetical protein
VERGDGEAVGITMVAERERVKGRGCGLSLLRRFGMGCLSKLRLKIIDGG